MATRQKQALDDRGLIRHQMRLGAGLIAFGAPFNPLFQMTGVLDGQTATAAFAVATGVIGAGAAMLPTGAAAGASARILRSLPARTAEPPTSAATSTASPTTPGLDRYEGEQWPAQPAPGRPVTCPAPCANSGPTRTTLTSEHSPAGSDRPVCAPSRAAGPAGRS